MRLPKKRTIVLLLAVGALCVVAAPYIWWGYRSAQASDELCPAIRRRYYPLRHWVWSGIFPFEGGFIRDPHFACSESMALPAPVQKSLDAPAGEFQLMDVNPAFEDRTSEILLLIRYGKSSFEYVLEVPKGRHVQAVLGTPDLPTGRMFLYGNEIALVVNMFDGVRGIYLIPVSVQSGRLSLIPFADPRFNSISATLKDVRQDTTTRHQFCETRRRDFIAFYERYAGSCQPEISGAALKDTPSENFDEFWKND